MARCVAVCGAVLCLLCSAELHYCCVCWAVWDVLCWNVIYCNVIRRVLSIYCPACVMFYVLWFTFFLDPIMCCSVAPLIHGSSMLISSVVLVWSLCCVILYCAAWASSGCVEFLLSVVLRGRCVAFWNIVRLNRGVACVSILLRWCDTLCCVVLCCIVLCCVVLYIVLCCVMLYCVVWPPSRVLIAFRWLTRYVAVFALFPGAWPHRKFWV